LFLALFLLAGAAGLAQAAPTPRATIEQLHASLLEVMRGADKLGFRGRVERLTPALKQAFDFGSMSRTLAGQYWSKATPAQQQKLTDAFARLSAATYASRFKGYSGQQFIIKREEPGQRNTVEVETEIQSPPSTIVPITYVLRSSGGSARIIDVQLAGQFSEVAQRRSDYAATLANGGVDAVIKKIESDIAALQSDRAS